MSKIPKAFLGAPDKPLRIADIEIVPFVLEDETRVITQRSLYRIIGITRGGASGSSNYRDLGGGARLLRFMDISGVSALIEEDLRVSLAQPIKFAYQGTTYFGYEARVLQKILRAIAKVYLKNKLPVQYAHLGVRAEILSDAFLETGIIALIDEFTGYKYIQDKKSIQTYLEKAIRREYAVWVQRFPVRFFESVCKLKGWNYKKGKTQYPPAMGHVINDIVYRRLAPGVLDELKKVNPVSSDTGRRKVKHHQWLTQEVGVPSLAEHLIGVQALMDANSTYRKFTEQLERVFPLHDASQLFLDFPEEKVE